MTSESASLLEYVLECLSVPVSVHDGAGVAVYQNAAHQNLFGVCVGELCHPLFRDLQQSGTAEVLITEGECVVEERLPGGRVATLRVVRFSDGEGYLVEVVRVKAVEEPHSDMETFVQSAAHDLKTPLVSIKGYAELLQRELGGGDGRVPTFLERLLIQAHRMENLLEELLDYARIGTDETEAQSLDPAHAAQSAWQGLQDLAEPVGASLDVPLSLASVRCTPMRLQQVFTNLFSNAIRYRRDDVSPRIRVLEHPNPPQGMSEQVFLAVEDNGKGVPVEQREKIFALFHRADQSCVGTGVGLAIVRRIVEGGGGVVWVEPAASGMGTRFVLSFPKGREGKRLPGAAG